jgi:hypothetical protein
MLMSKYLGVEDIPKYTPNLQPINLFLAILLHKKTLSLSLSLSPSLPLSPPPSLGNETTDTAEAGQANNAAQLVPSEP